MTTLHGIANRPARSALNAWPLPPQGGPGATRNRRPDADPTKDRGSTTITGGSGL